ncbi:MAG: 50S ribosomal protein L35 [Candidatus Omnitrophota bacterium]|nr:MAG: 50S ribosomal protein L35 [Candidatus Omnitrophota bacterium]
MGKLKTKKGVRKRYKITKKGKVKHSASGKSHLLTEKNSKRIRSLRRLRSITNKRISKQIKRMLPYG